MTTVSSRLMPFAAHQFGELLTGDVVAGHRIVEVQMPVDLLRGRDMTDVVEQHILVGFDDLQARRAQMRGQPLSGHEPLWMGVSGERGIGVGFDAHVRVPFWVGACLLSECRHYLLPCVGARVVAYCASGPCRHRSVTSTPTAASSSRTVGRPIPTTDDGSPSMRSTNQPPSPSRVNAPATDSGSPVPT